ncbi:glycoside hydrolase family 36 protein [Populibacterium corticicola]|uniref:Glycoside hydrolase family 36 protein n=1 Tax=Populibacterium corticicola TaxID=1812826 RepID=A0ABW5XHX5_9MICO
MANLASATELQLWADGSIRILLRWNMSGPVAITVVSSSEVEEFDPTAINEQPLVELLAVGHGRSSANLRNTSTAIGNRLRYVRHDVVKEDPWTVYDIVQHDPISGLTVTSVLRVLESHGALESWTKVRNDSSIAVNLQAVSSLMIGRPIASTPISATRSIEGTSEWLGETRWANRPLRNQSGLPRLDLAAHQSQDSRGSISLISQGTWSSGQRVPSGVLAAEDGGRALAWQVTHNGPWRVEFSERLGHNERGYLVLGMFGPTDADHAWLHILPSGAEFTSVRVAVAFADTGWQSAIAHMSELRRASRRRSNHNRPVIYNDYMNTLMGDPTTEKLLPLIDAAAQTGADYFCIDCGWYDETGDWWDSVGEWTPSTTRFPDGGLIRVIEHIRAKGLIPGLWLEPEVIGVRSPMANKLPDSAFLQRNGVRIVEHDRYLLDLRSPAARAHLDAVVDRIVNEYKVGYFKFDYNVTPGLGTDLNADSPGDGLLQQNRAQLEWVAGVFERHPELVIENCASGGMRADYALLEYFDVQSTSDQQNPLLYPPVAAGSLVSMLPDQAANWAYPQPEMTDEQIVFTMCTGIAGRLQLSGKLDQMSAEQRELVVQGVELAKNWFPTLRNARPFWPLGLPQWDSEWVAVGHRGEYESLVVVWWRGKDNAQAVLEVPPGDVSVVYPAPTYESSAWEVNIESPGRVRLAVSSPHPQARVLRIRHT